MTDLARQQPKPSAKFVLMVGAMAAVPAATTDMYLPSLPVVAAELDTTDGLVKATITGVLIGGAIGQLLIGPLSDRFGRRRPVMIGLAIHVVTSLLCALVSGIVPLLVLRVLQGVGNAAAMTTAMAVIRDRYYGATASAILSRLMLVVGVIPLLAPTVGSAVALLAGWRAVFVVLAVYGLLMILGIWRFLPESLPTARRSSSIGLRDTLVSYAGLLKDTRFMAYAVMPGLGLGAVIAYVSGSPFVLQGVYGLDEQQFAFAFAIVGIGLVAGSQVNASLVRRFEPLHIMRAAAPLAVVAGVVLVVVSLTDAGGLIGLIAALWVFLAINAMLPPNASALAMSRHGERAGSAAAVIGSLQSAIAGLVGLAVELFAPGAAGMAWVMFGVAVALTLVLVVGTPAYRRGGATQ